MKIFLALLLTASGAFAQPSMRETMPSMQMPTTSSSNPTPPQPNAGPDPLAEISGRPPLTLPYLLAIARARNPTLRTAQSTIAESAGHAKQAGLLPNPVIGYEGDQIRGGSYGGGEQGGFVQQAIPLGGKLGLRRDALRAQQRTDELALAMQQQRIEADIENSFYAALTLQQEIDTRKQLSAIAADAAQTARQLANVGQADAPDVLQSEVEQEQAALDTVTAQRHYIAIFHQLIATAGQPDLPLARLAGDLTAPAVPPPSLDAILEQSPAVQRADQAVVAAEAQLHSAHRDVVPDLTVRAGEQWNNELIRQNPNIATGAQSFASASIDLPLWNRNQGNIAAAQAAVEQAQAEAQRVRLALRRDAAPLVEQYNIAAGQTSRYKSDLLPRAQRAYDLYRDRYSHMAAAYPQVLVSQRTLFQLQLAYIQSLGELWQSAAQLRHFALTGDLTAPAQ
ncbi:MAG TPA: TolC family protein [Acidobacteriaceae bacterium]|jgi:cobalt-zinc-cadmium efflux system outer membrane protein